jgi:hypothetical protein
MLRWAAILLGIPALAAFAVVSDLAGILVVISLVMLVMSLGGFVASFFVAAPKPDEARYESEWSS